MPDHHKRAVLTELPVRLINDKTDEGVGNAVPDPHHHGKAGGCHHRHSHESGQIVGNISHHEQVKIRRSIVQRKSPDPPQRNAMNTVSFLVL